MFAPVPGCGEADRVSVVCQVTKRGRRYRLLPGRMRWGFERPLEADLDDFMEANPESEWLGPRLYTELLERVGVTRALREVLAIPQGAIDRIVEERPPGLLRNLLELTGEGAVLEAVHSGRESTERARAAYVAAIEQDRAEQEKLVELQTRAARYLEWAGLRDRLVVLEELARPAAAYRDLEARVEQVRARREAKRREIAADQGMLGGLADEVPTLEARVQALAEEADGLAARQSEAAALESGGVPVPPDIETFRARLAERGIDSLPVAQALDLVDESEGVATRVEAALGEALWGLVVPSEAFREATMLASESGYRRPIVRAGAGDPAGALASVAAPSELGLLLERSDALPALDASQAHGLASRGHAAVTADGMRYSEAVARLEAPEQPLLRRGARDPYPAAR